MTHDKKEQLSLINQCVNVLSSLTKKKDVIHQYEIVILILPESEAYIW